jgi:hypothetical protein
MHTPFGNFIIIRKSKRKTPTHVLRKETDKQRSAETKKPVTLGGRLFCFATRIPGLPVCY